MAAVDILLPAYNAAATIEDALRSLQDQDWTDLRVIVVDDGSTDATSELVAALAKADDRILLVRRPNGGIVSALNAALDVSSAKFVGRLDADDLSLPRRISSQVAYLRAHSDVVGVAGQAEYIDAGGRKSGKRTAHLLVESNFDAIPSKEPYLMHPFLMMRGDILRELRYRNSPYSEDTDLYWRAQERGRLVNTDEVVGLYRVHESSTSNSGLENARAQAVASQLAAISAKRRKHGLIDLEMSDELARKLRQAPSLEAAVAAAKCALTDTEINYLAFSAIAKLIETSYYRAHVPKIADLNFAKRIRREQRSTISAEQRAHTDWVWHDYGGRLLRRGHLADALKLLEVGDLPPAIIHAVKDVVRGRAAS